MTPTASCARSTTCRPSTTEVSKKRESHTEESYRATLEKGPNGLLELIPLLCAVVPDAPMLGAHASAGLRASAAKKSYMLYTNFGTSRRACLFGRQHPFGHSVCLTSCRNFGGHPKVRLCFNSSHFVRMWSGVNAELNHPHKPPDGGANLQKQFSGGMFLSSCCLLRKDLHSTTPSFRMVHVIQREH